MNNGSVGRGSGNAEGEGMEKGGERQGLRKRETYQRVGRRGQRRAARDPVLKKSIVLVVVAVVVGREQGLWVERVTWARTFMKVGSRRTGGTKRTESDENFQPARTAAVRPDGALQSDDPCFHSAGFRCASPSLLRLRNVSGAS